MYYLLIGYLIIESIILLCILLFLIIKPIRIYFLRRLWYNVANNIADYLMRTYLQQALDDLDTRIRKLALRFKRHYRRLHK